MHRKVSFTRKSTEAVVKSAGFQNINLDIPDLEMEKLNEKLFDLFIGLLIQEAKLETSSLSPFLPLSLCQEAHSLMHTF
jgi:hypothetical protein